MKASSSTYAKKARRIRKAGKKTEQEFFGKGGPLEVKNNPITVVGLANPGRETHFRASGPKGRWAYFDKLEDAKAYQQRVYEKTGNIGTIEHVAKKNPGSPAHYPFYMVGAYEVATFSEAVNLGQAIADRTGQSIHVMEKLDRYTPFHSLREMHPVRDNPITVVGLLNPGKKKHSSKLVIPEQIDPKTFSDWVKRGALKVTSRGDENTYGVTEFGHEYYMKDYGAGIQDNPPRSVSANIEGIVYNRCIEIRAEKTGYKKGFYKHPFSRGSQVCIYALDNGDLLVHSKAGVKLWQPD